MAPNNKEKTPCPPLSMPTEHGDTGDESTEPQDASQTSSLAVTTNSEKTREQKRVAPRRYYPRFEKDPRRIKAMEEKIISGIHPEVKEHPELYEDIVDEIKDLEVSRHTTWSTTPCYKQFLRWLETAGEQDRPELKTTLCWFAAHKAFKGRSNCRSNDKFRAEIESRGLKSWAMQQLKKTKVGEESKGGGVEKVRQVVKMEPNDGDDDDDDDDQPSTETVSQIDSRRAAADKALPTIELESPPASFKLAPFRYRPEQDPASQRVNPVPLKRAAPLPSATLSVAAPLQSAALPVAAIRKEATTLKRAAPETSQDDSDAASPKRVPDDSGPASKHMKLSDETRPTEVATADVSVQTDDTIFRDWALQLISKDVQQEAKEKASQEAFSTQARMLTDTLTSAIKTTVVTVKQTLSEELGIQRTEPPRRYAASRGVIEPRHAEEVPYNMTSMVFGLVPRESSISVRQPLLHAREAPPMGADYGYERFLPPAHGRSGGGLGRTSGWRVSPEFVMERGEQRFYQLPEGRRH
ncbi:hypothetical protein G7046_g3324 [Stylonectria norvegica]|nr:hypothetical protein G7046_g3324 [Stylonectria norvegica]